MSSTKQNSGKAAKYGVKINVGMIIFLIIFLYIVFSVYSYFSREKISYYEVLKGGIVRESSYTGIALREEQPVNAQASGYIHYFIQEGRRTAAGANVYTVDETGDLEKYLAEHPELTEEFSREQLEDIRYRLSEFSARFENSNFQELYRTKYSLDASALEYSGISGAEDLDTLLSGTGIRFSRIKSAGAGVVSYVLDGYEDLNAEDIREELFSGKGYQKRITKPGALIESGTPVYKLITSSSWALVFPLTEEERLQYQDIKSVQIRFPEKDLTAPAALSLYTAGDGKVYGKLSLRRFMEEFEDERFIDFEIVGKDAYGLKIPLSSVAEKEFYIVPKDFLSTSSEGKTGFLRQSLKEGGVSTDFVEAEIYRMDEQYCYLNVPENADSFYLKTNDVLQREDSGQTYSIGATKTIQGVYNINKGYCVFRQVVPIETGGEYMIVQENTDYGIAVYDHIILNAALVQEGQLIYQ